MKELADRWVGSQVKLRVEEHGGEARSAKELAADGCYYMLFKDPEGNRFSVYENSGP